MKPYYQDESVTTTVTRVKVGDTVTVAYQTDPRDTWHVTARFADQAAITRCIDGTESVMPAADLHPAKDKTCTRPDDTANNA